MHGIIIKTKKGDFGCFDAKAFEHVLANYEIELSNIYEPAYRVVCKRGTPIPSDYAARKEMVRDFVTDLSYDLEHSDSSYLAISIMTGIIDDLGKKYGLLTEFEDNGII